MKRKIFRVLKWTILILLVLFFFKACIPAKQDTPSIKPRQSTKYWNLNTGSKIAYTFIEGKGVKKTFPIIYLHGGPGGYVYTKNIEILSNLSELGYDVYLYDQIGSGLSNRLEKVKEYTADRHRKDLEEIVKEDLDDDNINEFDEDQEEEIDIDSFDERSRRAKQEEIEKKYSNLALTIPNLIHESVPVGKDETANIEIKKSSADLLRYLTVTGLFSVKFLM